MTMKNKFKRFFLVLNLILILTALSCSEANSTVAEPEKNLPKITSIDNVNISIYQGETYSLPEKVKVTFENNTSKDISVNWEINNIPVYSPGVYKIKGTLKEYSKELEAKVEIKALLKENLKEIALKADKALRTLFNGNNFDSKYSKDNYGLVQNYKDSTELLNYLNNYFTEAVAKDIIKTFCKEMDGRLYVRIGQAGMRILYDEKCNVDATQKNNVLYLHFYEDIGGDTLTQKSELIYENGLWLFNNWWYI